MPDLSQKIIGVLLGSALVGLAFIPRAGVFFVFVPVFFITYLRFVYPLIATWFLSSYVLTWVTGHYIFHLGQKNWIMTEIVALFFLFWVPSFIQFQHEKIKNHFSGLFGSKKIEFEKFKAVSEDLKKENIHIEKQLREIGHLYDVIKDLGSTLNVQEMIELIKQFTERMFDLPHFVIAILSPDGKKYELCIASGCDESFLKSIEIDVE